MLWSIIVGGIIGWLAGKADGQQGVRAQHHSGHRGQRRGQLAGGQAWSVWIGQVNGNSLLGSIEFIFLTFLSPKCAIYLSAAVLFSVFCYSVREEKQCLQQEIWSFTAARASAGELECWRQRASTKREFPAVPAKVMTRWP